MSVNMYLLCFAFWWFEPCSLFATSTLVLHLMNLVHFDYSSIYILSAAKIIQPCGSDGTKSDSVKSVYLDIAVDYFFISLYSNRILERNFYIQKLSTFCPPP